MIAEELINHMVPPLKLKDDAHKSMVWMEELRCHELPVVDNELFLGFITEELILEVNDAENNVSDFELIGEQCIVQSGSHFYEVIKTASENDLKMVAVNNPDGQYMGVITIQDTINSIAQTVGMQMSGSILVLSIPQRDYTLSQISRLVEENDAKILSSTIKEEENDPSSIRITLKINKPDLTPIVATFERFGYNVVGRFQDTQIVDSEKDRIDMLFKFLDI